MIAASEGSLRLAGCNDFENLVVNQTVADHMSFDFTLRTILHGAPVDVRDLAVRFFCNELHGRRLQAFAAREDRSIALARSQQSAMVGDSEGVHDLCVTFHQLSADIVQVVFGTAPPDHADVRAIERPMLRDLSWLAVEESAKTALRSPHPFLEWIVDDRGNRLKVLEHRDHESGDGDPTAERNGAVNRVTDDRVFGVGNFPVTLLTDNVDVGEVFADIAQDHAVDISVGNCDRGLVLFVGPAHSEREVFQNNASSVVCEPGQVARRRVMIFVQSILGLRFCQKTRNCAYNYYAIEYSI